jgi:hypothetical protein
MKPTEAIDTGYTPQPAPIKRTTTPIHDLVIIDLITYTTGNHLLAKEIDDRKKIGLAEYGTYLQAFNGRDCETDAIEEIVDMICYLKQGIMEGKDYLEPIYHRAIALAVDTINLRAINAKAQERKAALATAPYYDVVVEVDGVESTHTVKALSREEAARQVLDDVTLGAEVYPDKVELISYDLA